MFEICKSNSHYFQKCSPYFLQNYLCFNNIKKNSICDVEVKLFAWHQYCLTWKSENVFQRNFVKIVNVFDNGYIIINIFSKFSLGTCTWSIFELNFVKIYSLVSTLLFSLKLIAIFWYPHCRNYFFKYVILWKFWVFLLTQYYFRNISNCAMVWIIWFFLSAMYSENIDNKSTTIEMFAKFTIV